jgi:hypothetical protein
MRYSQLVSSFITTLHSSGTIAATIWNGLTRMTLCPVELTVWKPLLPEDALNLINDDAVQTMTKREMRGILLEMGLEPKHMVDNLKGVAIDDSYYASALIDLTNPDNPTLVHPCDFAPFAHYYDDEDYFVDGVFTWKAIQKFAPVFAAANHIAITQDCEILSFPMPRPRKLGRTARRRARAKKARSE